MNAKTLNEPFAGIVSVQNWTMVANGRIYQHFFSERWIVITDKGLGEMAGLARFRSTEGWQLLALRANGDIAMLIPGCQVKGFSASGKYPFVQEQPCFHLEAKA